MIKSTIEEGLLLKEEISEGKWKKRWAVLSLVGTTASLSFYKISDYMNKKPPLGIISLSSCNLCSYTALPHAFDIIEPPQYNSFTSALPATHHRFQATKQKDFNVWFSAIGSYTVTKSELRRSIGLLDSSFALIPDPMEKVEKQNVKKDWKEDESYIRLAELFPELQAYILVEALEFCSGDFNQALLLLAPDSAKDGASIVSPSVLPSLDRSSSETAIVKLPSQSVGMHRSGSSCNLHGKSRIRSSTWDHLRSASPPTNMTPPPTITPTNMTPPTTNMITATTTTATTTTTRTTPPHTPYIRSPQAMRHSHSSDSVVINHDPIVIGSSPSRHFHRVASSNHITSPLATYIATSTTPSSISTTTSTISPLKTTPPPPLIINDSVKTSPQQAYQLASLSVFSTIRSSDDDSSSTDESVFLRIIGATRPTDYTEYIIEVFARGSKWMVHRRYNNFYAFYEKLVKLGVAKPDRHHLPPKQFLDKNSEAIVKTRMEQLGNFLLALINDYPTFFVDHEVGRGFIHPGINSENYNEHLSKQNKCSPYSSPLSSPRASPRGGGGRGSREFSS
eukprot:TRINITY_DN4058_c2_g1_i1.p1 TRINITY_DN4058_c2_g1~~TRINITY_DN4058_c2_g1_i1.p1  ORF type:complete len:591 (+),score=174.10 TRINITY_DN4058_c2_g1_i1:83-1774(+)